MKRVLEPGLMLLLALSIGVVVGFAASPSPTVEETCKEYVINWESMERVTKDIPVPAPESLVVSNYDRCLKIVTWEGEPFEDATAPRVLNEGLDPTTSTTVAT